MTAFDNGFQKIAVHEEDYGIVLANLSTKPEVFGQGYASSLLTEVIEKYKICG